MSSNIWTWRTVEVISVAMLLLMCWGCDSPGKAGKQPEAPKAASEDKPSPNVSATKDETAFARAYEEALKRIEKALVERDKELLTPGPDSWIKGPRKWASMRFPPLVEESSALAKRVSDRDVAFLRNRLLEINSAGAVDHGPFYRVDARLAVLTLARSTPRDRAAKELGWLIKKNVPSAVYAMSLLPLDIGVPVLTEIAEQYRESGHYMGGAVLQALVLLTIQGGKDSYKPLKALDTDGGIQSGRLLDTSFHDYVARLHKRLSMSESKGRESRRQEELVYWQCFYDRPHGRVIWVILLQAAWRHNRHGVHISRDVLRSRLTERYAIAVAAVQDEKALIPELKALAAKHDRIAEHAQRALKMMSSASQSRPSGSGPDAR